MDKKPHIPDYFQNTDCEGIYKFDIFTQDFLKLLKNEIESGHFEFIPAIKAIIYFYVFPSLCNAGLYAGKMYSEGSPEVVKVFPERHLYFPTCTEVDTEINSILPLNKASEKLQLTLIRYPI